MGHGAILRSNDKRLVFKTNAERFWPKVQTSDDCWSWLGARMKSGHGKFWVRHEGGSYQLDQAHRFAYELLIGPIPKGALLDHIKCDHPWCVNPGHTEPSTHRKNILRGIGPSAINARKATCNYDHPFDELNTLYIIGRNGLPWRLCRACVSIRNRNAYLRKKGQNR